MFRMWILINPYRPTIKSLWLIGPTKTLGTAGHRKFENLLRGGGNLGILCNKFNIQIDKFQSSAQDTGLEPFLSLWGLKITRGLIQDRMCDSHPNTRGPRDLPI